MIYRKEIEIDVQFISRLDSLNMLLSLLVEATCLKQGRDG